MIAAIQQEVTILQPWRTRQYYLILCFSRLGAEELKTDSNVAVKGIDKNHYQLLSISLD